MEATDFTVLMELMTLTELVSLADLEGLVELMAGNSQTTGEVAKSAPLRLASTKDGPYFV